MQNSKIRGNEKKEERKEREEDEKDLLNKLRRKVSTREHAYIHIQARKGQQRDKTDAEKEID